MVHSPWSRSEAPPPPLAVEQRTTELIGLGAMNALLTLVTLGIWRFWARARVRREIWAATALFGDRLEYTGTGGELFRGFLKGLGIFLPMVLVSMVAQIVAPDGVLPAVISAAVAILGSLLLLYGTYAARRYVASRSTWRGLRFALDGAASGYMASQVKWGLLLFPTLGLAYPWLLASRWQWLIGQLRLGSARFGFDGGGRDLIWPLIGAALATALLLAAAIVTALTVGLMRLTRAPGEVGGWPGAPDLVATGLMALSVLLPIFWFKARVMRWQAAHTTLAGARFAMPGATLPRVAGLLIGNGLMRLLSLGVLGPVATARTFTFYARHLQASGLPDLAGATQAEAGPRTGEGLEALFGGDAFAG